MADDKAAGAPAGVHGRRQAPPPSHEPAQAASAPAEPDGGPVQIDRGEPLPLGLHDCRDGLNVAVFSRHATSMTLLLYETAGGTQPSARFPLNARRHRTGDIWHVSLTGGLGGKLYALRADGPRSGAGGDDFDPHRTLLDPYAASVTGLSPNSHGRCVIADQSFDWADDAPLRHPWSETILYETHVRGLTIDASSGVRRRGEYLGVVEKIPYFRELGITALELMPVQAFDPEAAEGLNPLSGERLRDYWGYNPVALFAPMPGYAGDVAPGGDLIAFKTMVRELHRAGIEIILDVVFNHTAEGGRNGPTYSFRGLDDAIYYILTPNGEYVDYTGCGNTLNCNHPVVRSMVVDCLRHWVIHCHVDGFRFDLASVLGRDEQGNLLANPPLLEQIAEDPILRDVKLIAEAWDVGGAFQVGRFPGRRWAEWNCHFRDDVRRFWRGDPGMTGGLATRLAGSSDLYQPGGESPLNSINFITSHDGFTLNDLVSYARKHNEANGEDNRDGLDENYSDNNGAEGPTDDPHIEAMRLRRIRNLLATLLLSRGVPMLLGGDEFRRTQAGNNNAYCQDNAISWYDWSLAERNGELVQFVRRLIALRKAHPVLRSETFYTDGEINWFGPAGQEPDWNGADNRLGCLVRGSDVALCLLFNGSPARCRFVVPAPPGGGWEVVIDTSKEQTTADASFGAGHRMNAAGEIWLEACTTVVAVSRSKEA
ncbi:glycogen debranching protein GlgX [Aurantimonas marianensis]|uniref:Glycogen debranching protein GlgX n=1 Tax=Aurantimonas marianensis TaxID=2920428 RepID=A0A9X2KES4_9HYPH|nr:glycogen debranching protein GlgX [Aurantimonas marianensis]MCP3055703.1 glycogen debranching protein GlgX [Aurantimonas marianensis]